MRREMPDHSAGTGPRREAVALAFQIEKSDDLAVLFRYQLDRLTAVTLLLALHGVEECSVEERQQAADQPSALVTLLVGTDHNAHCRDSSGLTVSVANADACCRSTAATSLRTTGAERRVERRDSD